MDKYFNESRKKIEEFFNSDRSYIHITGPENHFTGNRFCGLLWPSIGASIKLSINFILFSIAYIIPYSRVKIFLYRLSGMKICRNVYIGLWVRIDPAFPELIK